MEEKKIDNIDDAKEYLKKLQDDLERIKTIREPSFWEVLWETLPTVIIVFTSILLSFIVLNYKTGYSEKELLKTELKTIITNGGDLDVVKHMFSIRNTEDLWLKKSTDNYYDKDISLSRVLNDLLVDYYSDTLYNQHHDTLYFSNLHLIINEYTQSNPFDALEEGQRVCFENVQTKLGDNYEQVQDDLLRISDALHEKNVLAKEYLQKANSSFWISVAAVLLTIGLGVWQILQNRKNKKILSDLLKSTNATEKN